MDIETEARYVVRSQVAFERLLQQEQLGPYRLVPVSTAQITDDYLDTRGHALLRQGWACRLRAQGGNWVVTLKGPKQISGAITARPELELPIPERTEDPAQWPHELRAAMHRLTGGVPLRHLVTIKQRRHRYDVRAGRRLVAELSLDRVRVAADGMRHRTYMLECELRPEGNLDDLAQIDTLLQADGDLAMEPRSKLQRALELVEQSGSPDEPLWHDQPPSTVEELAARFDLDSERAGRVAALAARLFEGLRPIHGLSDAHRATLWAAAYLHGIGTIAAQGRAATGRDILWRYPIAGQSDDEQAVVAAAAYLHRGRATPERIAAAFISPPSPELEDVALAIAALVRMAAALDAADCAAEIAAITLADGRIDIQLANVPPGSAQRARRRSDLWQVRFATPIAWHGAPATAAAAPAPAAVTPREIGITPPDSMSEAGLKIIAFFYQRMLEHEAGTRLGRDPEELHDMRVATRRLRSALALFGPYLPPALVESAGEALRRLGRLLGEVRDMDVALGHARAYLAGQAAAGPDLTALFVAWRERRGHARQRLLRYFHSRAYPRLRAACEGLIAAPPRHVGDRAYSVRQTMPRLLLVAEQRVRAYDVALAGAPVELLHALRIDGKRLRYAFEFFAEVLPPDLAAAIPTITALQDHLGELHDAAVAAEMVEQVLAATPGAEPAGLIAYRDHCAQEAQQRRETFPAVWAQVAHKRWHKRLASLLAE